MYLENQLALSWINRLIAMIPERKASPSALFFRYGFAAGMVVVAYGVRELIGPPELGLPVLTFFFAAAISAIIGGVGPGLLAAVIGAPLATYLYIPPYHMFSYEFAAGTIWTNVVFFADVIIVCLALRTMHITLAIHREAEEKMRQTARVFDMMAEAVVVADAETKILTVNAAFTTLTGYAREEAVGKTTTLLQSGRHGKDFYNSMWKSLRERGCWQGEIWNRRKNGEIFLEWLSINAVKDANGRIVNYVGVFRDITIVKGSQQRMEFLATHDELTTLPNRVLLNDRLRLAIDRAERAETCLALLIVDLDNFKMINDTLGHEMGDDLLMQTASRLKECVRAEDTVARMGGDEFVVLLEATDKENATVTAERILHGLSDSYKIGEQECFASASVGISFFPNDAIEQSDLLRHADTAMYRAKEQGKNNFQFFSNEMAESSRHRLNIERGLRHAIKNQELFIEYQPQIDMRNNELVGAEALIRWQRDGQVVPPLSFIPVAEESSLIIDIGEWVVGEACRQLRKWNADGLPGFSVSVNISARHFRQMDMVSRIKSIVLDAGVAPCRLCLEITEGAMENVNAAMSMLTELHEFGFKTSVDDFGTGFSSLSHLKRFPIHELKIDRSFVDGIVNDRDDRAITSAIISMAGHLGLRVVAEGVETEEQLSELQSLGCDIGQGYFYAKPLPVKEFDEWVVSWIV